MVHAAGAEHAKIFVLCIDDIEASVHTAETVQRHFPHLRIIARARNRRHAHRLMDMGIKDIFRETLLSSVALSECVLIGCGVSEEDTRMISSSFQERDERLLAEQHAIHDSEEQLIQTSKETADELASLLREDQRWKPG